jgi:hypothetical protein
VQFIAFLVIIKHMNILNIGDIVKINQNYPDSWQDANGQCGIVIGFGKRLHIPAAKIFVLGEICEFDLDEIDKVRAFDQK